MLLDIITNSRDKLLNIFDNLDDEIAAIDKKFIILSINKKMAAHINKHPKDLVNKNYLELFAIDDKNEEKNILLSVFNSKAILKREREFITRKGEKQYIYEYLMPIMNEDGEVTDLIICRRDITDLKIIEENLLESEKLASIGTMTAGIAHELRNPFTAINMKTQIMLKKQDKYQLNEHAKKTIKDIEELTCRGNAIVDDILIFSQGGALNLAYYNPEELLRPVLDLVVYKTYDINIIINNNCTGKIHCDKARIEHVFSNIISNACDAMDGKGKLTINILEDKKYVIFKFTDTGKGMPENEIKRIFDPFYTTKSPGKGTGLGLSICQHFVKRHKGYMNVISTVGEGTTFTIGLLKDMKK